MAVLDQLLFVLLTLLPNEPHGGQNGCFSLVGRESGQPLLGRQLDIHTEPIGQKAQLTDKLGACAGNGLGVDIAVEAVLLPQKAQSLDHALGGVVRIAQDAAGEKKTFNIIAAVELDGQLRQLPGREGGTAGVVAAAIDAVFAVVYAAVGHEHLQQGDTTAVSGKAVAAAGHRRGRIADLAGLKAAADAAGCAGGIVFGGVRENGQLFQQIHVRRRCGCGEDDPSRLPGA